ncbi:hypothetical protein A3709_19235 [Halioglobus sp. HI00S01]|nr:hypothetical protein A3709_19235 [Halioglobus sp. HI00S01]
MFCHLGNGISVANKAREVAGDYEKVAHISAQRDVTWYADDVPVDTRREVDRFAATTHPQISTTQQQKVFSTPPTTGYVTVATSITGDEQMSEFMNASLSVLDDGTALSIAVRPPEGFSAETDAELVAKIKAAFHGLSAQGWAVEVQAGPNSREN